MLSYGGKTYSSDKELCSALNISLSKFKRLRAFYTSASQSVDIAVKWCLEDKKDFSKEHKTIAGIKEDQLKVLRKERADYQSKIDMINERMEFIKNL